MIDAIPAFSDNYIWTIIDDTAGMMDCIDPGDASPIIRYAKQNQLTLRTILLTHHHPDHIGGVAQLLSHFPKCIVYGPHDGRIPFITHHVAEHDTLLIGPYSFQVLFNPGHTSTHISYFEPKQHWLFCGDTLFSAGCGRVFDGTIEQLHQSLALFKTLPLDTKIFCAHEYTLQNLKFAQHVEPTNTNILAHIKRLLAQPISNSLPSTLGHELTINPFLRTEHPSVKKYALSHGAGSDSSIDVFKTLRTLKNTF